ncbi:MAG: hypothetical protein HYX96_00065 [Chloroflexi bacterium]|nr:hypothetical protein [Chloroflexota bacterium]
MQIKKTYKGVNPGLLYDELRDFILKRGVALGESKLETYAFPNDSSSFITRGTMTFTVKTADGRTEKCVTAHVVGSVITETKLMLDIDESLFPGDKIAAFEEDIDFIFGAYEARLK